MARQVNPSNAVVQSCEQAAALFGVASYRMNSRTFQVVGAGGRERPMFMGQWTDRYGEVHRKGMADLLMTPRIELTGLRWLLDDPNKERICSVVPLWVECKFRSGHLEPEQRLFRDDVLAREAFYLEIHDGPDALIEWFKSKGVRR